MNIHTFSHDQRFLASCRAVVETWAEILGAEFELSGAEAMEGSTLPQMQLLILDADGLSDRELELLEKERDHVEVLFVCTQNSRQAIRCYSLRPTAFLSRNFSVMDLDDAMGRCVSLWQGELRCLEVTENRSRVRIPLCEILWAEAMGHRSVLHGMRREVQVSESLNDLAVLLPETTFIRSQRSYIVNLYHVKRIDGKDLIMSDESAVSIGRTMRPDVQQALSRFRDLCLFSGKTGE